jgi:hypothetical protein
LPTSSFKQQIASLQGIHFIPRREEEEEEEEEILAENTVS